MRVTAYMALVLLLAACGGKEQAGKETGGGKSALNISTLTVAPRALAETVRVYAEVEAAVAPEVAAEVSGRITAVLVEEGQQVRAGQPLARLDAANLADARHMAEAEVERLQALVVQQMSQVKRDSMLVERGFISPSAMESSSSALAALQQQLEAAESAAAIKRRDAGKAVIVAPLSGQLEARLVSVGDFVGVGKVLFRINASGARRVKLAVGGEAGERLQPGQALRLSDGSRTAEVKLSEVRAGFDAASRSRVAYAPLPADTPWRVGDALDGELTLSRKTALAVPLPAVVERPKGMVVYVVKDGRARERAVSTGLGSGDWVEIVSGLKAGETVAVDGAGFLSDKAKVKPVEAVDGKPAAGGG
ncbi:efflux RND transporter periplasmic adaptor subunit [Pseudogulbenkiania sp. MAI-1]|uniref:efflux RND transporter periplasmic adaptor subunit n=1 Tax=Pseudogulbenkiania sp. MAI-1 TaxID=990370 RepID=UPI00045E69EE|nr:efflux RND transporter periplasmic adaptor subunit [Pseudogulbenkiania sp. MAI-1]